MGSSAKKKKEKKKDFQKTKLRVGKTKAKPENFTDTSFKAKSIVLNQQSLHISAPSADAQFTHHLSLTSSKSDTQRRDSLAHLTTSIVSRPVDSPLPQPVSAILPTLLPLILDASNGVRTQLLKLLRALPPADVQDHVAQLLPYIRAGMTHLAADLRVSAVEVLAWLVDVAGAEVVACAGGWIKTLNCFLSVLGWHTEESSKWSSSSSASVSASASATRASFGKAGAQGKPMIKMLGALAEFLQVGIGRPAEAAIGLDASDAEAGVAGWEFPLRHAAQHMVPRSSAPYIHLNLFGQPRDEEGEMYETREDRYRVFASRFLGAVQRGLEGARGEGGEVGRASAGVSKVLKEAIAYGPGP
ncbi:IPI1/TEX10 family protein [Aspergillus clavatus NRRL 1]|uniref:Pre-rRNA-processing protein ipi1 n=1 Tax=Aspergillus clavatus (strain ATCC 1007 / CBS 513.65 / DSM 816 / NCTC 3887 / NRRL 1 / QM 1276 / 107) TaxID=344612 RepID=IPI1_ASPCL|nr:rRNA processing protein Ipi1, putative [Aspergillus clavatus NRRL 1]A1CMX6.1 RecName: Full=Pre-rRNA-processing protein ipi1 [Aspergillus clavatus NRRL 1]EAW08913.1 rRNA processing protein Ipi1, putative [Aspergillus clavatus NRRL 1]